jgi:hypothetical protein
VKTVQNSIADPNTPRDQGTVLYCIVHRYEKTHNSKPCENSAKQCCGSSQNLTSPLGQKGALERKVLDSASL